MAETGAVPHPRAQHELVGHAEAERSFSEAIRSGRLHHAWLVGGPEGIGKATLAYRVARRLLAGPSEWIGGEGASLAVAPSGRTLMTLPDSRCARRDFAIC